jgi:hypothetical protein
MFVSEGWENENALQTIEINKQKMARNEMR